MTFTTANSSATIIPLDTATKPTKAAMPTPMPFPKFKETWLLQVAADWKNLPHSAVAIAIAITKFMNRISPEHDAFPGMANLLALIPITKANLINAIRCLEARGHLRVYRSRKSERENSYYPVLKTNPPSIEAAIPPSIEATIPPPSIEAATPGGIEAAIPKPENNLRSIKPEDKPEREARHSGSPTPPNTNPIIQTKVVGEEVKIGTNLITSDDPSLRRNRSLRGKRLPEDWRPSPKDEAFARDLLGDGPQGWAWELGKFLDYYCGRAVTMLDWSRTWRNWCRRAAEWKAQRPVHSGNVTVADAERRIRDGEATAADVRLVKDHNKVSYGVMLRGVRSDDFQESLDDIFNRRQHDGTTLDLHAEPVIEPAALIPNRTDERIRPLRPAWREDSEDTGE